MVDKRALLERVKEDRTLVTKLSLGLTDVTDEKEITFQLPVDPADSLRGRPYDHVYLRREGAWPLKGSNTKEGPGNPIVQRWYRIINGMAGGYVTDQQALGQYIRSGEQLTLEV